VRIILFTGKGGVGKTTAAAGTATLAARRGERTLVLSTDAAHSLADALGVTASSEPTEVERDLWVQHVDAQRRFEQSWAEIQHYLRTVLHASGVDPITAEELTVIPGAEEVFALLELRSQARSERWDVVIVDCAPTAETLRLLALPEALGWYMERVLPMERRLVKALKPVLAKAAGVPMPEDSVFEALQRLHGDLHEVHELLTGKEASVRLVLTPESVVVAEARRSLTSLSLFGYRVDGVIANRIFPSHDGDPWRAQWVEAQSAVLDLIEHSFPELPIWRSGYRPTEPVGVDDLHRLVVDAYGEDDPLAVPVGEGPLTISRRDDGALLRIDLPFAERGDVHLARHADELVISVGSYRRILALPSSLARLDVAGARVEPGALKVRFRVPEAGEEGS
jgi:arsenite-transporting ATPase